MIRPILFNADMVRAILGGRKTVTRRPVRNQAAVKAGALTLELLGHPLVTERPPCAPGDTLWVRETWADLPHGTIYRADGEAPLGWACSHDKWRPSIHMPKDAARIFLRVTGVRPERLQDMTEEDAIDEGYSGRCPHEHTNRYMCPPEACYNTGDCPCNYWYCNHTIPEAFGREIWDPIYAKRCGGAYSWAMNPWVWVISFERCERPEGWPS